MCKKRDWSKLYHMTEVSNEAAVVSAGKSQHCDNSRVTFITRYLSVTRRRVHCWVSSCSGWHLTTVSQSQIITGCHLIAPTISLSIITWFHLAFTSLLVRLLLLPVQFLLFHSLRVCTEPSVGRRSKCKQFRWYRDAQYLRQHVRLQPHDKRRWSKGIMCSLVIEQQTIQLQAHSRHHTADRQTHFTPWSDMSLQPHTYTSTLAR